MNTTVLVLGTAESPEVQLRCEAVGGFLHRMAALRGESGSIVTRPPDARSALESVTAGAVVFSDGDALRYAPTRPARDRVTAGEDGYWNRAVATRHKSVARSSVGAIVDFPLVPEGDEAGGETAPAQAFVTDWSGMHGSCALVVHPAHPLSPGLPEGADFAFTGRFCRHPISGDLLPIWVATWVKAEFGTGAVVVNPAHNKPDLAFARAAGLPIRFALVAPGFDASPKTWMTPPFIKSGVAYRTGTATDGKPFNEARDAFIAQMVENGLAEPCTDNGLGAFTVAGLAADDTEGTATIAWDPARRTVATGSDGGPEVRVVVSAALAAADPSVRASKLVIVTPSALVETDLLAARLLLVEPSLEPAVKDVPDVHVVGAASIKAEGDDEALRLAMLVNAKPLDTLTLKPQHLEPAERFLRAHGELLAAGGDSALPETPAVRKAASQIKNFLAADDLKQGFTALYRLQKTLVKSEALAAEDVTLYETLAWILAGAPATKDIPALKAVWDTI